MVNTQFKKMLIISACIVSGMFVMQGLKAYGTLNGKAVAQDAVTENLVRWKEMFLALSESRQKWDNSFRREDTVEDMVHLISHVGFEKYGIETDNDNAILTKVEQITQGESPIGITKICMATGAGDGGALFVRAQNYQTLMKGIEQLARRPDIYIATISLQGDKAFPLAKLGDFCILLRNN